MKAQLGLACAMVFVGLAGCVPANHVQRPQLSQPCEVKVCTNARSGLERCNCARYRELADQMRVVVGASS